MLCTWIQVDNELLLNCLRILHGEKVPVKSSLGICGKGVDVWCISGFIDGKIEELYTRFEVIFLC